ncbi:MAG: DUF523 and DUF1722 domain-containing protein [Pseudomonadota bacterium]
MTEKIIIGVSACLLGQKVRYDGGHQLDRYIRDDLGLFFDYLPVCPEVEAGLPVPREPLRLVDSAAGPRLVFRKSGVDFTDRMRDWARERLDQLEAESPCGFIFKSKSPSSGLERVKVHNDRGVPSATGTGVWAAMFKERFPLLPVEDEGRLHDPKLREMFIEKVFVLKRWRDQFRDGRSLGRLVEFHTRHKLLIMAHDEEIYRELGRLTAAGKKRDLNELLSVYLERLAKALSLKTTTKKNLNVLRHIMGYFKKVLTPDEKRELLEVLDVYARGDAPLIVPVTLLNHYVRKFDQAYLREQYYLAPHPVELRLRNQA